MSTPNHLQDERSRFGYAFIKSGYEDIADDLVHDFAENGLEVIHQKRLVLPARVVDYIYRDSAQEHFYPAMRLHLTENPVSSMALYAHDGHAQQTLLDLKFGMNGRDCLRAKYARGDTPIPDDEIRAWLDGTHPAQGDVTIRLTQRNVFHTADSTDEAINTLRLLGEEYEGYYGETTARVGYVGRLGLLLATLEPNGTIEENYA